MHRPKIKEVTEEQRSKLLSYKLKWQSALFSSATTEREAVLDAATRAYQSVLHQPPEIVLCSSPRAAMELMFNGAYNPRDLKPYPTLTSHFSDFDPGWGWWNWSEYFEPAVRQSLETSVLQLCEQNRLPDAMQMERAISALSSCEAEVLWQDYTLGRLKLLRDKFGRSPESEHMRVFPMKAGITGWLTEFFCRELGLGNEETIERLDALYQLIQQCWRIYPCNNLCVVSDRPTSFSVDALGMLHSNGTPALQFSDGFEVYAYHGRNLPKKYGQVPFSGWQVDWLLEDESIPIRHELIKEIGYYKICQQLPSTELDVDGDRTLLRIDADIKHSMYELPHLLKDASPLGASINFFRVPTHTESVKKAYQYIKKHKLEPDYRYFG